MNINSATLEELQVEYKNTLLRYNQDIAEYKSIYLQKNNSLDTQKESIFNGTERLRETRTNNLNDCKKACQNNQLCSGATYFNNGYCNLRKGSGEIEQGSSSTTAIVPKSKILLQNIKMMNEKLSSINKKMVEKMNASKGPTINVLNQNETSLKQSQTELAREKEYIDSKLDEYDILDAKYNDHALKTTQNLYMYILTSIVVILCVIILIGFSLPSVSNLGGSMMSIVGTIDKNVQENFYSLIIIIIAVPITYYFFNWIFKKSNNIPKNQ